MNNDGFKEQKGSIAITTAQDWAQLLVTDLLDNFGQIIFPPLNFFIFKTRLTVLTYI